MRENLPIDSPRPSALGRLALAAIVAGSLAAAEAALADRACVATNPLLQCSEAECLALQANVNSICKNPAPVSCRRLSGCNRLKFEQQRWKNCALARDLINGRCWGGGDPGHLQASGQAWQNVSTCAARIALPEPIGCADPCPQIPGFTAGPPAASSAPAPAKVAAEEETLEALLPIFQILAEQGKLESLLSAQSAEPAQDPAAGDEAAPKAQRR